jgi:hypothetical protein
MVLCVGAGLLGADSIRQIRPRPNTSKMLAATAVIRVKGHLIGLGLAGNRHFGHLACSAAQEAVTNSMDRCKAFTIALQLSHSFTCSETSAASLGTNSPSEKATSFSCEILSHTFSVMA